MDNPIEALRKKIDKHAKGEEVSASKATETKFVLSTTGELVGEYRKVADDHLRLHYIFLGDILNTALSVLFGDNNKAEELRVIVGTIGLLNQAGQSEPHPLSNIPISLDLFEKWFIEECIKTKRSRWSLLDFLNSLILSLIHI